MKILSINPELTFKDVLLLPGFSEYQMVQDQIETDIRVKISKNLEIEVPICSAPMPSITETEMAISMGKIGGIGFIHCFQSFEKQLEQVRNVKKHNVKLAVSVSDFSEEGIRHVGKLLKLKTDLICVETAHGYNKQTIDFIKKIKLRYPKSEICASLVVTGEATKALIKAGADSIRVGIGGGSHCTTRLVTGVGRPQLSAILECYQVAKKYNVPVISDTGIEYAGDIAKAIAFGASAVMIGGLFTGTEETPGKIIKIRGKEYKFSAGMCSKETTYQGKKVLEVKIKKIKEIIKRIIRFNKNDAYISSYSRPFLFTHEGVSGLIPYKGSVLLVMEELIGGLRRSMWYLGCKKIEDIREKTKVVVVTNNTIRDNLPRI